MDLLAAALPMPGGGIWWPQDDLKMTDAAASYVGAAASYVDLALDLPLSHVDVPDAVIAATVVPKYPNDFGPRWRPFKKSAPTAGPIRRPSRDISGLIDSLTPRLLNRKRRAAGVEQEERERKEEHEQQERKEEHERRERREEHEQRDGPQNGGENGEEKDAKEGGEEKDAEEGEEEGGEDDAEWEWFSTRRAKRHRARNATADDRAGVRKVLVDEVIKLQKLVDANQIRCPLAILDRLLRDLQPHNFTKFSRTLDAFHLSLPQVDPPKTEDHDDKEEGEVVRYVLRPGSHIAQTIFIHARLGALAQDVVRFAVKITKLSGHKSATNVYVSAPEFYVSHSTNSRRFVRISQLNRATDEPINISCSVGGEVRNSHTPVSPHPPTHASPPPPTHVERDTAASGTHPTAAFAQGDAGPSERSDPDETAASGPDETAASGPSDTDQKMADASGGGGSTQEAAVAGRPLKCLLKLTTAAEIRFDLHRPKKKAANHSQSPDIWACTKLKRENDSRKIAPYGKLSFISVPFTTELEE